MLKYRRIIAGILAVNLLAGSILLDYTEVNANNVNTSLNMISADFYVVECVWAAFIKRSLCWF